MPPNDDDILYYNRDTGELCREPVLGEGLIKWAYQSAGGRGPVSVLFRYGWTSRMIGTWVASRFSRPRIAKTIESLGMDPSEFRDSVESYTSFNNFFTRHLDLNKRPHDQSTDAIVSPADGRVLAYPAIGGPTVIPVKGIPYTVDDLLQIDAKAFHGGDAVVVRLCPADYHRFHFPCDGRITTDRHIPGEYHSVNPIALALGLNIFCENKRCYSLIDTERFGEIAIIEVGAFAVASIVWTYEGAEVTKMQERGYFEFGGSTIVLLLPPGRVQLDDDLIENSRNGYETLVRVGERIGVAARSAKHTGQP